MIWEAKMLCPAKINLHLMVGPKRGDGYHTLLSIFHMVDLCDKLWLRSLKEKDFCRISGDFTFPQEQNILYRVIREFRAATGIRTGFEVRVEKSIPEGAGLGGGSSNAACALRLLNGICGDPLTAEELLAIGARLGSDVPFFLRTPAAVVTGRGEIIDPVPPKTGIWCVLANPGVKIGTAEAYRWIDESGISPVGNPAEVKAEYLERSPARWTFSNSFEIPVFNRYPRLAGIKSHLVQRGAVFAGLSGSGSTVFGLFEGKKDAEEAALGPVEGSVTFRAVKMLAILPIAILQ